MQSCRSGKMKLAPSVEQKVTNRREQRVVNDKMKKFNRYSTILREV